MTHEIVDPSIASHKERSLTFIKFSFVKILRLGHDKFPRDTQSIRYPVINSYPNNLSPL